MSLHLTSKANPRVRALRAALGGQTAGLVGIEGLHLLREAVCSGLPVRTLAVREDRADVVAMFSDDLQTETLVLSPAAFQSAAMTEHAQGVAAVLEIPAQPYVPRSGDLLLLADGVRDPGNLGTLIRSAEAFGAAAVALTADTVSPGNGKCLRAAAGASFRLPLPAWDERLYNGLRAIDAKIYGAVAHEGRLAHDMAFGTTAVLVIGNEAAGISEEVLGCCDARVTLATPGPTESLNAAVAGSLLLYEASQQRLRARP